MINNHANRSMMLSDTLYANDRVPGVGGIGRAVGVQRVPGLAADDQGDDLGPGGVT